jgi:hypothetical protein
MATTPVLDFRPGTDTPYVGYADAGVGRKTVVKKYDGSQWVTVGQAGFSEGPTTTHGLDFHPSTEEPYIAYADSVHDWGAVVQKYEGDSGVSIRERETLASQVEVFPNPGSGEFRVQLPTAKEGIRYEVLNIHGKRIERGAWDHPRAVLHMQDVKSGIYWLRLRTQHSQVVKRIVKID